MKQTGLVFLFLILSQWAIGQPKKVDTEVLFKRYLVSEDESVARMIINSKDGLYSLYCQGALTEDLNEKIELYSKFIQQNPKQGLAKAYLSRGVAYTLSEKKDSALLDYNKNIELDGKEPYAYYFRGESYASLEDHEKAIEDYSTAIKMDPSFMLAYQMRGISFLSQKDHPKALADLNKTLEFDEKYDQAYLVRGIVYEEMGEYKKAIADWKMSKKLNKENAKSADALIEKAQKTMKGK